MTSATAPAVRLLLRRSLYTQCKLPQRPMQEEHPITSHYSPLDGRDEQVSSYQCDKCEIKKVRHSDGSVKLRNPNIAKMPSDYLYHLALGTATHNLPEMFGNVKFVVTGGTPERMEAFAEYMVRQLKIKIPAGLRLHDISKVGHRYSLFKVGPVISVSHGMGAPSIGILLHELIKLMAHAHCKDPIFFRMGTCGGVGLPPGSVVVSSTCCDGMLDDNYTVAILGKKHSRPGILDKDIVKELLELKESGDKFLLTTGKTMCTDDFYEGQGRIDGAFAHHTEDDKLEYLRSLQAKGVVNIEMESNAFAAITNHAGIKGAVVCVTLLNRLEGDQIDSSPALLEEFQERPMTVIGRYIRKYCETRNLKFAY